MLKATTNKMFEKGSIVLQKQTTAKQMLENGKPYLIYGTAWKKEKTAQETKLDAQIVKLTTPEKGAGTPWNDDTA